ncbi:ABC transporter permease [uncultured Fretibacterium sp.]|uniref:ABC transporter permease n=1 Tax=uncultured Fretibacterium sp. TaxID=1678694 RepID=UPI00261E6755|nr:ABC transporter permease [uncultured Fretibacterium sp.]
MTRYVLKRLLYSLVALFVAMSATFFIIHSVPGNPIEAMTEKLPESLRRQTFERYGFDRPLSEQYVLFWKRLLTEGDLGESLRYRGRGVGDILSRYAPVSGVLGLTAILWGAGLGVTLGVVAALHRGRALDYAVMLLAILGVSIPNFVLASLFQYFLAVRLGWFPVTGWGGFAHVVLPALALSFYSTAQYARFMRASCLEVLSQDYILAARARGMSRLRLVRRHVLRNAILPIVTLLGPQIALMFGGAFVVERIFSVPGLGFYFVSSVGDRDYTLIMGQTVFLSALYILSMLAVDVLYGFLDPRIRFARDGGGTL